MAPLPESNTPRYFVDYEGQSGRHTIMFRIGAEVAFADAVNKIVSVITALKTFAHTSVSFNQLRVSQMGSEVSFPAAWTPIQGTNNGAQTAAQYPTFLSFVGRDYMGRRVRYTLQGALLTPDTDYRLLASENAGVNAVLLAIAGGTVPLLTISGTSPVMNQYANTGYNAYFQRKRRRVA